MAELVGSSITDRRDFKVLDHGDAERGREAIDRAKRLAGTKGAKVSARTVCGYALAASAIILGLAATPAFAQTTTTTTYTYDALGRLTSAVNSPSGRKVVYAYDAAGNRVQVGNGVTYQELLPTAFTSSGALAGSGLSPTSGMKDRVFDTQASYFATLNQPSPWVQADLGSVQNIDHLDIAPAADSTAGFGAWNLNGSVVEYQSGSSWVSVGSVSGAVTGSYFKVPLGGIAARYLRVRRTTGGVLALGDFRLYSSNDSTNEAPIANPNAAWANPATATPIAVLANDTDADGDPLSISAFTQPANGTVTQSGSNLIYTPRSGYSGTDTFSYTILDRKGASAQSSVSVNVLGSVNHPPIADTSYGNLSNLITVQASDPDGDPWSIASIGTPTSGSAEIISSNQVKYYPTTKSTQGDHFTYTVSDGRGGFATSSVITYATNPSNSLSTQPDTISVQAGKSITFDPRTNDTAPAGVIFVIFSATNGRGISSISSDGSSITYIAPPWNSNYNAGWDTIYYNIVDQYSNMSSGYIKITITP